MIYLVENSAAVAFYFYLCPPMEIFHNLLFALVTGRDLNLPCNKLYPYFMTIAVLNAIKEIQK